MSFLSRIFGGWKPAGPDLPFDPGSPEGLAARWVRWAALMDCDRHPIADRTGQFAADEQPGDVWFLAGTFGGEVARRCAVPTGVPLFFPAFAQWNWDEAVPPPPGAYGALVVDGEELELDPIVAAVPFTVTGGVGNPVTGGIRPVRMTVWGLWKRLDPLPPGEHTVRFAGGDGQGFSVTAVYHLTVG